jgi:hypothetical protein
MLTKAEKKKIIAQLTAVKIGVDLLPPEFVKLLDTELRWRYVEFYGFALHGKGFVDLLSFLGACKVLGVCSGLAYYERLLLDAGVNILATDKLPPPKTWMPVEQGDLYAMMNKYVDRDTVFCSWPLAQTFTESLPSHVKRLVVIGECYPGGCCDDLSAIKGTLIQQIEIPVWECFSDMIYIYKF